MYIYIYICYDLDVHSFLLKGLRACFCFSWALAAKCEV